MPVLITADKHWSLASIQHKYATNCFIVRWVMSGSASSFTDRITSHPNASKPSVCLRSLWPCQFLPDPLWLYHRETLLVLGSSRLLIARRLHPRKGLPKSVGIVCTPTFPLQREDFRIPVLRSQSQKSIGLNRYVRYQRWRWRHSLHQSSAWRSKKFSLRGKWPSASLWW